MGALQRMGGDLGLAVETPPSVKEALLRGRGFGLRPTIATRRRGQWRLL